MTVMDETSYFPSRNKMLSQAARLILLIAARIVLFSLLRKMSTNCILTRGCDASISLFSFHMNKCVTRRGAQRKTKQFHE